MIIKEPTGWLRRWRYGSVAALLLEACGDDATSKGGVICGEGTEKQGDECVPSDSGDGNDNGDGSADGDPGPDPTALSCGAGTIEVAGKCVVDPDTQVACGDGTIAQDGKCVVAPPPPASIEGLVVSHLAVRNKGKLVQDGGKISQYYPIEVSVGLKYSGDAANIPVVFALGEPPGSDGKIAEDAGFCLVGGFPIAHPGGEGVESIASATLHVPKHCLGEGENARLVNPIVLIDPDQTVGAEDQSAVTRIVAFAKANTEEADMAACRIDATPGAAAGTCQIEFEVDESPGLDFELRELTAESSVVVLDKCANSWDVIADGTAGVDADRPVSYRCNKSIVADFKRDANGAIVLDEEGSPVQNTYTDGSTEKPKFVYGAADLALDVTLITYGADDSVIENADEAEGLAADADEDAVNNVLTENGLQLAYHIRPAQADDESAWKKLYLHKEGEQAKAGEEGESGQDPTTFEETQAVPATPHYYSHGLYVENDCGERNLDTCDSSLNTRTDIIYGEWSQLTDFVVRACIVPVDLNGDEDASVDGDPSNNCKEIPIKLVRHDTAADSVNAQSYGLNYQWGDGVGSQSTLRLGWGFHTWNNLTTAGATIDNEAAITLGSDLIGYTDVLKGWAKGAAYVSIVGSYYDYGVSTFGVKLWGDAREVPEFHWEKDWNVSKELRKGTTLWAGVVPVRVEIRLAGIAGVTVNVDVVAVDKEANGGWNPDEESESYLAEKTAKFGSGIKRIGLGQLTVTPYGNITATASAAVDALVVRVGVAGELTLLDLRTPFTGRLWWGMTSLNPPALSAGAWADLKLTFVTMRGRVYVYAENWSIRWCSSGVDFGWWSASVSYPCGDQWNTFWDYTIASWSGWTWNQTLWSSPYYDYTLQ